ncbi:MAG TPA: glycosyltransferase family 9 protein, partial [Pirellulaceae bacterium]|nr:glycosyltransferase family 9 protein [Pirellulaceae bacterium]
LGAEPKLADCTRSLAIDAVTRERVKQRLRRELGTQGPLLGVHPGNLGHAYNWSIGRYAELVQRLMQHGRVLVTGSPKEIGLHAAIRKQIGEHPGRVAYVDDLSLRELIAAIEQLDVLTVSSTGPLHLAGVLGTPVVGLFSTHIEQSPLKWAPYGPGHLILQAPLLPGEDANFPPERGTEQMERISVDEVAAAVLSRVNRRQAV